jgi:hypothetical protein
MGKFIASIEDQLILPARACLTQGREQVFRLAGRPIPAPVLVRLLIDTGSKRSTLIPGVIGHLNSAAGNDVRVETGLATVMATLFWVRLEFPDTSLAPIPVLAVARLRMPPMLATFHGLIGRDLIRHWESLLIEGRRGRFILRDAYTGLRAWFRR